MSLTRNKLTALGIEGEKLEEIISAHADTVNALNAKIDAAKADAETYKAQVDQLMGIKKEFEDYKKKVEAEAKEREGKDYDALKKEYDDFKAETERKAVRGRKEEAYKEILKDAGIPEKHWAKILKYSDVDGVELDDKGKVTTAKDLLKEIKEEWGDHVEKESKEGAPTATPPEGGSGGKAMSRADILKISDTTARQKAIAENLDLFNR